MQIQNLTAADDFERGDVGYFYPTQAGGDGYVHLWDGGENLASPYARIAARAIKSGEKGPFIWKATTKVGMPDGMVEGDALWVDGSNACIVKVQPTYGCDWGVALNSHAGVYIEWNA